MTSKNLPQNLSRLEFAAVVVKQLKTHYISCVLVGGSCVSIYTNEKYISDDLDFISPYSQELIACSLEKIGFEQEGRYFKHKDSHYYVEFPSGPVSLVNKIAVEAEAVKRINNVNIQMLSPTQSVMDRLAAWFYWQDRRSLFQAIDMCLMNDVDFKALNNWSAQENEEKNYQLFLKQLSRAEKNK